MSHNVDRKDCHCQKSRKCPLQGKCIFHNVVYKAVVTKNQENVSEGHIYVGLAGGLFKKRLSNHVQSFNNFSKRKQSKLSEYVWDLKQKQIVDFEVKWKVIAKETTLKRTTRKCQLCSREKYEILKQIQSNPGKTINKREEIYRRCLHRQKHFLGYLLNKGEQARGQGEDQNFWPELNQMEGQKEDQNFWPDMGQKGDSESSWGKTRSGKTWRKE